MHYLYKIADSLNNKIYIGQSNKEFERWRQHKWFSKQDNPIQYIHRAMAKYGIENFTYEVIAMCKTQAYADEVEAQLIIQYDSRNKDKGYNISLGGDIAWNRGLPTEQQPMYGKHHSEESRKKISESNMGKYMPPRTEDQKRITSETMTGRIVTQYTRDKVSKSSMGRIISDETKLKMSNAKKGKKLSEEHKVNLSKAITKFSLQQEIEIVNSRKSGLLLRELAIKYDASIPTICKVLKSHK